MRKLKFFYTLALTLVLALSAGALVSDFPSSFISQKQASEVEGTVQQQLSDSSFSENNLGQTSDEPSEPRGEDSSLIFDEETVSALTEEKNTHLSSSLNDEEEVGNFFKPATFTNLVTKVQEKDMQSISPNKRVTGSLEKRGDKQFYVFSVGERGYIELDFVHDNISASGGVPCWDVYLYERYYSEGSGGDRLYRELTVLRAALDNKPALSNRVGVYPGTYVIMVTNTSAYSSSEYGLIAGFKPSNDYEAEFNDSIYRYNEIYSGRPIKGSSSRLSSGTDLDFFMFEMKNAGYIDLSFEHEDFKLPSIAWRINLTDAKGRLLYAGRSSMADEKISSGVIGLKKGLYFIEVASHEYHPAQYTLTLTATSNNNYEAEPNDSFETANILKNNLPIFGSLSLRSSPMERDFYKISLPSRGYLQIFFEHKNLGRDLEGWNIYIYNSNKNLIYSGISYWSTSLVQSPKIGLPPGDYYISIDAENRHHNPATYSLRAEYVLTNDWEFEDNNSHTRANPLSLGSSIHGALVNVDFDFDVDYFYFELEERTKLYFRFEHKDLHSNSEGWVISLRDSSLRELTSLVSRWNQTSVSSASLDLPAGKYYIKVDIDSGMHFSTEEYRLSLYEGA